MAISVTCGNPECGKSRSIKDQFAGLTVLCPSCRAPISVPPSGSAPPLGVETSNRSQQIRSKAAAPLPVARAGSPKARHSASRPTAETAETERGIDPKLIWLGLGAIGLVLTSLVVVLLVVLVVSFSRPNADAPVAKGVLAPVVDVKQPAPVIDSKPAAVAVAKQNNPPPQPNAAPKVVTPEVPLISPDRLGAPPIMPGEGVPNIPPLQVPVGGNRLVESFVRVTDFAAAAKDIGAYGYLDDISILSGWVIPGGSYSFTQPFATNTTYCILAAGDNSVKTISLQVIDATTGQVVVQDPDHACWNHLFQSFQYRQIPCSCHIGGVLG